LNLLPFVASGLGLGAIYGMSGVGLVVLYRASGTFNFAFGALGALSAHCAWSLIQVGAPAPFAWAAGVALTALISYLYGRFVSSQLVDRDRSVRAIATLGLALFLLGVVTTVWGPGLPRRLSLPIDNQVVAWIAAATHIRISYTRVVALSFAVVAIIGVAMLLERTRLGLAMRALASDRAMSSLIGVSAPTVDAMAWLISGAFAGLAGLFLADLVVMSPVPLTFLVIPATAAAVIGRLTSMTGAFVGGLIGGFCESLLTGVPELASVRSAAPYLIALLFISAFSRTPEGARL
jgi:branched-chain amino acid transport system permease protein